MRVSKTHGFGCAKIGPGESVNSRWGFISKLIGERSPRPALAATQVTSVGPSFFGPQHRRARMLWA